MKIMIVEDDETLAGEIASFLARWGYDTVTAERFDRITEEFALCRPQLVLMDINLPCYDGFYWCRQIRQVSGVPVLYISSRDDDRDKIMAIAQGGDDYVEKPLRMELLRAKIEAMLRRTYEYKVRERIYLAAGLCFDCAAQSLYYTKQCGCAEDPPASDGQTEIELTKSERRLFARLVENRPDVVTRDELMMELWNTDEYVTDAALTTIISRLRTKLKSECGEDVIHTKKGQGYYVG